LVSTSAALSTQQLKSHAASSSAARRGAQGGQQVNAWLCRRSSLAGIITWCCGGKSLVTLIVGPFESAVTIDYLLLSLLYEAFAALALSAPS